MMTIEQLNAQFGIAGKVELIAGNGGLPMIQVKTAKPSKAVRRFVGRGSAPTPKVKAVRGTALFVTAAGTW